MEVLVCLQFGSMLQSSKEALGGGGVHFSMLMLGVLIILTNDDKDLVYISQTMFTL